MPIYLKRVARANPQNRTQVKFYPSVKTLRQVPEKEVAKLVADETTLNPKEAEMAIQQYQKILTRFLLDSNSVQLGDWGSFHLTCSSEGVEQEANVNPAQVKGYKVQFTPGKELRNALRDAHGKMFDTL